MKKLFVPLFIACVFGLCGCKERRVFLAKPIEVENLSEKTKLKPATKIQAEEFVSLMKQSVHDVDQDALTALISKKALLDRALFGLGIVGESRSAIEKGFEDSGGVEALYSDIISYVKKGGRYEFVRMVKTNESYRPLFRLEVPNGGVNYHEFILDGNSTSGSPTAVDTLIYVSGEEVSTTIRRAMLPAISSQNESVFGTMSEKEIDFVENQTTIQAMSKNTRERNFERVLTLYDSLPDTLKDDKNVLTYRLRASQAVNESVYVETLRVLRELDPDDISAYFLGLDFYMLQGEHKKCLDCIAKLEERTQDKFLGYYKAVMLTELNALDEAEEAISITVEQFPNRDDIAAFAITILLSKKDWKGTTKALTDFREKFEYDPTIGMDEFPEGVEFLKSDEYKVWRAKH